VLIRNILLPEIYLYLMLVLYLCVSGYFFATQLAVYLREYCFFSEVGNLLHSLDFRKCNKVLCRVLLQV